LSAASPLRKVSLARLEAAVADRLARGERPDDAMLLLAGLQRITHVLVYPEQHDIVLAGPAEGWKVDAAGHVVGRASGRPVLQLADLAVALSTAPDAAQTPIACSIDPTDEGISRLEEWLSGPRGDVDDAALREIERLLGPQQVIVAGVPDGCHLARVLVAADYRMKLLAMGLVDSPVAELKSFPELLAASTRRPSRNAMPRWWLAPRCEAIAHDTDFLAWELRGLSLECLTEDNYVAVAGGLKPSGRRSDLAVRWAEAMTGQYAALAQAWPVFAELEACVDLAVVGAIVARHDLRAVAGCELPILSGIGLEDAEFAAPRQTSSQATLVAHRRGTLILVSGGVEIDGWKLVEASQESADTAAAREANAAPDEQRWWWD
jgi:hypothetical protein